MGSEAVGAETTSVTALMRSVATVVTCAVGVDAVDELVPEAVEVLPL